ncbi:MAG TPA: porin family protein [Deltaproteobacteria bacterium]|jgi:opacity protein-like surface antigen|nr:porin family protein [Deltaproteobacteria bacterium]HQJ07920.1 porin family protein [Deltaproteobacteria bacterium]
MKRLMLTLAVFIIVFPMTAAMAHGPRHERGWHQGDRYSGDNYAAVKIGAFMPDGASDFLDNGFAAGAALGHKLGRNFALEFGLDYISTDFHHDYSYDEYGYEDAYLTTFGIPVTAKFIVPLSDQVELYAGAGVGVYFTGIDFDNEYYDGYYYEHDRIDDTGFGFHTLIGADIKMSSNTAFTMELKYTEIDHDFNEYYDKDFEIGGTTASAGIKFLF